jgi:hypothetical protein
LRIGDDVPKWSEIPHAAWELLAGRFVIDASHCDLANVVRTGHPTRCLAGRLHCRQKQSNQNPNDRNDHEQLDERKAPASLNDATVHLRFSSG